MPPSIFTYKKQQEVLNCWNLNHIQHPTNSGFSQVESLVLEYAIIWFAVPGMPLIWCVQLSMINEKRGSWLWLGIFDISIKQQLTVPQANLISHVPFNTETKTKLRNFLIHLPPSVIFDQKYRKFSGFLFWWFFLVFIKFEYLNISVCTHIFVYTYLYTYICIHICKHRCFTSNNSFVSNRVLALTTSKVPASAKDWNNQHHSCWYYKFAEVNCC